MKTILFQGDSVTDGGWDREAQPGEGVFGYTYPTFVKSELSYKYPNEYRYINRGVSGNRTVDLYARIKPDIIALAPDYLSILIGINDVWHDFEDNGLDARHSEIMYDMLLSEIKESLPDTKIMLLEPFVLQGSATKTDAEHPGRWLRFKRETALRAEITKKLAEKYGCLFVPLQEKFDELASKSPEGFVCRDGVHPTGVGAEIIKNEWIKAFERMK